MDILIKALSTSDDIEWDFFLVLKWDMQHMSNLQHKYTQCEQQRDRNGVDGLQQELVDCSLGREYYMREMGLWGCFIFSTKTKIGLVNQHCSTLFGFQFAVSSRQCTCGAYCTCYNRKNQCNIWKANLIAESVKLDCSWQFSDYE